MMREKGIIKDIENGIATIETVPSDECRGCKTCGSSSPKTLRMGLDAGEGLMPGDQVEIEVPSSSMMKVYLLLYAVPLTVFLGTALLIYMICFDPLLSFAGSLAATVSAYFLVAFYLRDRKEYMPRICAKR